MSLGPAVVAAADLCKADRRFKDVHLTCEIPQSLPMISADEHRLRQVIVNLLLNAGDAVGGKGSVWVKAQEQDLGTSPRRRATDPPSAAQIQLIIEDDGPGVAEELLPRIFDPFFTTKDVGQGTGLGLSICASIMEGFGGDLRAENRPEGGARFVASFRTAEPREAPPPVRKEQSAQRDGAYNRRSSDVD
jgi:signal transduction histidine kinase